MNTPVTCVELAAIFLALLYSSRLSMNLKLLFFSTLDPVNKQNRLVSTKLENDK